MVFSVFRAKVKSLRREAALNRLDPNRENAGAPVLIAESWMLVIDAGIYDPDDDSQSQKIQVGLSLDTSDA